MLPSELIERLTTAQSRLDALARTVDVDGGGKQIATLEKEMTEPGFWDNNDRAQETIAQIKKLKAEIEPIVELRSRVSDLAELAQMAIDEEDEGSIVDIADEAAPIERELSALELAALLSGEHDGANCYLSIHAGAGGTESCDWANMLARMYTRFAERQGYKVQMVEMLEGEEAGLRSVTYHIKGLNAYGYLKAEGGVHRLVRISPFDAKGRRHTSFVAVDVAPELPDTTKDIEINESDLRIDTYRASGAGGQHVNRTDSAVRITHAPSGIVVQCQNERSQHSNRNTAMKILRARLIQREEQKREEELLKLHGAKGDIAFGAQIRSYTLQPFTLVKDHRTSVEVGNSDAVLDGEIMPFIEGYLQWRRGQR